MCIRIVIVYARSNIGEQFLSALIYLAVKDDHLGGYIIFQIKLADDAAGNL